MICDYLTTGINQLEALPCGHSDGRSWRIRFESSNTGCFHQLYANAALVAWTDSPQQREFIIDAQDQPQELAVVACSEAVRSAGGAAILALAPPPWQPTVRVVPSGDTQPGDRVEVRDEDQRVLVDETLMPPGQALWSFGHDTFGLGGFGFDGRLAPGLGAGGFGAGEFGFDAFCRYLRIPPLPEGRQNLTLRVSRGGAVSMATPPIVVVSAPPPAPAHSLRLSEGDALPDMITFEIERG